MRVREQILHASRFGFVSRQEAFGLKTRHISFIRVFGEGPDTGRGRGLATPREALLMSHDNFVGLESKRFDGLPGMLRITPVDCEGEE